MFLQKFNLVFFEPLGNPPTFISHTSTTHDVDSIAHTSPHLAGLEKNRKKIERKKNKDWFETDFMTGANHKF